MFKKKKMNLTPLLKSLLKLSLCAVSAEKFFCVVYNAGLDYALTVFPQASLTVRSGV